VTAHRHTRVTGAPLSVPAPVEVLEAIAQQYGLESAHWRTGRVWRVDRHGPRDVRRIGRRCGLRLLGGPLAFAGEHLDHGDAGGEAGVRC